MSLRLRYVYVLMFSCYNSEFCSTSQHNNELPSTIFSSDYLKSTYRYVLKVANFQVTGGIDKLCVCTFHSNFGNLRFTFATPFTRDATLIAKIPSNTAIATVVALKVRSVKSFQLFCMSTYNAFFSVFGTMNFFLFSKIPKSARAGP